MYINMCVIGGSRVLVVSRGKAFSEIHIGGWDFMVKLTDCVKLREVLLLISQCPIFVCPTVEKVQSCLQ